MPPRPFQAVAQSADLFLQLVLSEARILKLGGRGLPPIVHCRIADEVRKLVELAAPHSLLADVFGQAAFEHLGDAAEFLADAFGLLDQNFENAVFGPLRVNEIAAEHFAGRLQLAVDAAVALVEAAGVPGQIEVKQIEAVALQVEPFPRSVRSDKNAQRMILRLDVEGVLDVLPLLPGGHAGKNGDPLDRSVGMRDCLAQAEFEITARILVLGKDEEAPVVPFRRRPGRCGQARAHVRADPSDDLTHTRIGRMAVGLGDLAHLVDERQLALERRPLRRSAGAARCRRRPCHAFFEFELG